MAAHAEAGRVSSYAEADTWGSTEQWMDLLELLGQTLRCLTRGRCFECHHRKMGTDLMFAPYRSAACLQYNVVVGPRMNGCSLENYPNALTGGNWNLASQSLKTESLKACSLGFAGIAQLMLHPYAASLRLRRVVVVGMACAGGVVAYVERDAGDEVVPARRKRNNVFKSR